MLHKIFTQIFVGAYIISTSHLAIDLTTRPATRFLKFFYLNTSNGQTYCLYFINNL